jgi:hypothetical protein
LGMLQKEGSKTVWKLKGRWKLIFVDAPWKKGVRQWRSYRGESLVVRLLWKPQRRRRKDGVEAPGKNGVELLKKLQGRRE